ncbi:MAG TPA: UDP-N-acetylmuramoyl-tripeptide--D-alanyl-D-alanine ligase, partial [Thermodesulfobacteriota bacterium]|nr:UDP-N-acetylmuramoyl-tripeptide--D-alanyl-D-alanine ligase [Thermodesulfobacteriota bacterium]
MRFWEKRRSTSTTARRLRKRSLCSGGRPIVNLSAGEIAQATQGTIIHGSSSCHIRGVSSDSRKIQAGELFVPIQGPNFDGHQFIGQALERGAAGSLARPGWEPKAGGNDASGKFLIRVEDPLRALGDLAHFWRGRHSRVKVVAITGSNGKTTTKEMAAQTLSAAFRVLKTEGNLNNLIGLPLMLLRLSDEHEVAVLEMGMNAPGEVRRLKDIAAPQVSLITNVGRAHLEFLGSLQAIARAKGELWEGLNPEDWIAVNADDPRVVELAAAVHCRKKTFGIRKRAEISAEDFYVEVAWGTRFSLRLDGKRIPIRLNTFGRHNVYNALGASALAAILGLDAEKIAAGLETFHPYPGRGRIHRLGRGLHLLDDTYNSNPDSLQATLAAFGEMKGETRGLVVLGDMLELGPGTAGFHEEAGKFVGALGFEHLFLCGEQREHLAEGAKSAGMEESRIHTFANPE